MWLLLFVATHWPTPAGLRSSSHKRLHFAAYAVLTVLVTLSVVGWHHGGLAWVRRFCVGAVVAAYGLFEEVMGVNGAIITKPLRVNVTAEDTVRVQISTAQFVRLGRTFDYLQEQEEEQFPFFCPLHKGDAHLGGTIRVVP